ncbi:hypothetical protein MNV49_000818 [Pseudohyphozyma bogoriensis]|nr:hypothetical protein MNV49_000818 [Pseudohyphozyma bogoriensis]
MMTPVLPMGWGVAPGFSPFVGPGNPWMGMNMYGMMPFDGGGLGAVGGFPTGVYPGTVTEVSGEEGSARMASLQDGASSYWSSPGASPVDSSGLPLFYGSPTPDYNQPQLPPASTPPTLSSLITIPRVFTPKYFTPSTPSSDPNALLSYFDTFALKAILAVSDWNTPNEQHVFRTAFVTTTQAALISSESNAAAGAFKHALFSFSQRHASNFVEAGEEDQRDDMRTVARGHRGKSFALLQNAGGTEKVEDLQMITGANMLLILYSIFVGDAKMVAPLLKSSRRYLNKLNNIAHSPASLNYSALHSVWSCYTALSRAETLDVTQLLWHGMTGHIDTICRTILGFKREMMILMVTVHNHLLRLAELDRAMGVVPPPDDLEALELEHLGVQSTVEQIEAELSDEATFERQWGDSDARVKQGHEIYRCAIRVYILRSAFNVLTQDLRIQACVKKLISCFNSLPVGDEVGMFWPTIIVGCEALGEDRQLAILWLKRCQWTGASSTINAETLLRAAWSEGKSWTQSLQELGLPVEL